MENMGLIEKQRSDLKSRNETLYKLSEMGLKTNMILYGLTLFSLEVLDSFKLDNGGGRMNYWMSIQGYWALYGCLIIHMVCVQFYHFK